MDMWSETSGPMALVTGTVKSTGSTAIVDESWWRCWVVLEYDIVVLRPSSLPNAMLILGSGFSRVTSSEL